MFIDKVTKYESIIDDSKCCEAAIFKVDGQEMEMSDFGEVKFDEEGKLYFDEKRFLNNEEMWYIMTEKAYDDICNILSRIVSNANCETCLGNEICKKYLERKKSNEEK